MNVVLSQECGKAAGQVSTPLAGMLPERYRNVDIKEVFPEFRENAVLRFSTLFPIKVRIKSLTVCLKK
jgi:transcription initiation factor TFIID subunit 1